MIYLDSVYFPSVKTEEQYVNRIQRTCYDTYYPFGILSRHGLSQLEFSHVTILYGGNGSGKSTALNVIADLIGAKHHTPYNHSELMADFLSLCDADFCRRDYRNSDIFTSDDVFDRMIDIRNINDRVDADRSRAYDEYLHLKSLNPYYDGLSPDKRAEIDEIRRNPIENYEKFVKKNMANSRTQSKYVKAMVADNIREHSNGETAFEYFCKKIEGNGIYLLDEPENSLSPMRQMELEKFLNDSARFYNCQLIIATHSPFLLAMKGARIYDLDSEPAAVRAWTELENVRAYYDFFMQHSDSF